MKPTDDNPIPSNLAQRKIDGSLRKVFLTVVAAIYLITLAGTLAAFYGAVIRISDEYVGRFARSQNLLEKNRILSILNRELALSRKLADDPRIREWMGNETDPQFKHDAMDQLASYHRFMREGSQFVAVSSSGNYYLIGVENAETVKNVLIPTDPADSWFFDALQKNRDYSLNVNYDTVLDEVRVWINVIVRDTEGHPAGIAGTGMNLTRFLDALVDHKAPGIQTIIVNRPGEIQAHRDRSIIEHNARVGNGSGKITIYDLADSPADRQKLKSAIDSADTGADPNPFVMRINGKSTFTTISGIPELDWYNLVLLDVGSVIGFGDFLPLGLVFLGSMLLILFSVVVLLNRLILAPLTKLTAAAGLVARGAYDTPLPHGMNNEIGRLSASFHAMTREIRRYTTGLEAMVKDRTLALTRSNEELLDSQKRIMDSIHYARLIQHSILPSSRELDRSLSDYFAILKPLDIVGGDFYFFRETPDGFCIAAVDCTGHGVPGAFMTMMVNALLNRVIETYPHDGPASMLAKLHDLVQETLRSESDMAHLENGLDIALCRVYPADRILAFAGGGLPIIVFENDAIREIRGDRLHLGFSNSRKTYRFTEHRMEIFPESRYYLLTDGIVDLPGGDRGFGLGRNGLLQTIAAGQKTKTLTAQKDGFLLAMEGHQKKFSPRDDILLVGFSVRLTIREDA